MLSAAILAGGQATRFHGVDKSALVIDGGPILERPLADERLKLIDLRADLRVRAVPAKELDRFGDHHHLVANLKTPAEYRDLATLQGHGL
jgi:molybdopterin-guanine dinucleotide biosynthesis protein A